MDEKTDPSNLTPTTEDLIASLVEQIDYLCGAIDRIESQLASDDPPPWAMKLFDRVEKLEAESTHRETVCKYNHQNGAHITKTGFVK